LIKLSDIEILEIRNVKELTEHLDISVNAVKMHYARAIKYFYFKPDVIIMLLLV